MLTGGVNVKETSNYITERSRDIFATNHNEWQNIMVFDLANESINVKLGYERLTIKARKNFM